ncbi:Response regulator [Rasamsonia emersonii CBS 393.64]|uniref:Response regulator n=1 Tax=Rasamsonia emersonii (strain ATCC 16479 / CBS 393.64 / IMI 116815) TaxID=1408163 RepID=A0A0F4YVC2_RASE3|nr:Response regulator [Rasamsonia emersonii CBS 393.64]KKA21791.1 Response regulator [Rasamsonia emersonii CBS 393.64]
MPERLLRLMKAREKLSLRRRRATQAGKAGVGADPENKLNKHKHQHQHHLASVPHPHRQQSVPTSTASSLPVAQENEIVGRAAAGAAKLEGIAANPHCGPGQLTEDDPDDDEGPRPAQHQEPQLRGSRKNHPLQDRPRDLPPGRRTSLRDPPPCHSSANPPSATTTASSAPRQLESLNEAASTTTKVPERVVNPAAGGPLHSSFLETVDEEDASRSRSRPAPSNNDHFSPAHPAGVSWRPTIAARRQSLLPPSQQHLVNSLLEPGLFSRDDDSPSSPFNPAQLEMVQRKVWVKRPGASPTLISIAEDSVVDELRDHVLRKYANSLGRVYDAPDLIIRISPRESSNRPAAPDRILSPEEPVFPILDSYYPGGQTVEEALIIDAPQRRTPRPSPRQSYYYHAEPGEHGEYFPLMPVPINVGTPPTHPSSSISSTSGVSAHQTPSISVLTTGKVPPLPSPGNRPSRHAARRPPYARHTTNSPTLVASASNNKDPNVAINGQPATSAPSLPTPPAPAPPPSESPTNPVLSPSARGASPRPGRNRKKAAGSPPGRAGFGGLIEGTVPPINVLIVEDNVINQKLLEAFMKRLSVRWQCAPNGEVAVKKWRQGGFHLVLMDIQLPVMNGLEATKEIRRLERLNGIGVFSKTASGRSSASSTTAGSTENQEPLRKEDVLENLSLFKSPVIIVALTASSLQSDRHEALAAGCNDFLTKPVGFPWLEQKVTEWGCMQALIDFEGWRKWRGYEDSPRTLTPVQSGSASPSPRNRAVQPAGKLSTGKDGSKVTVTSPGSSGSGSSEETEVPSETKATKAKTNGG